MFINLFVCRYSDFLFENFTKVFGINPLMAFLFAPKTSVWISLNQRHQVIWGELILNNREKKVKLTQADLIRSLLMNSLLSIGSLFLNFFTQSESQYAMEAIKWSLFTWKNYLNLPNISINNYDYFGFDSTLYLQDSPSGEFQELSKESAYV